MNSQQFREMNDTNQEFVSRLVELYGTFVPPSALWKELGFTNSAAFRKALAQERVEVKTFDIAGRRGSFARSVDVGRWQATVFTNGRSSKK